MGMERGCFTYDIIEGSQDEYKKRHDEIWPEMLEALTEAGFSNYTLFRRGTQIVTYGEFHPNLETALSKLRTSEVFAKWDKWFGDILVNFSDENGELKTFTEVWHFK